MVEFAGCVSELESWFTRLERWFADGERWLSRFKGCFADLELARAVPKFIIESSGERSVNHATERVVEDFNVLCPDACDRRFPPYRPR